MRLPTVSSYGNYSSSNYGAHTLRFDIGGFTFWYSYKTLVAFKSPNNPFVVHSNIWGPTTGKHLNMIDGGRKKDRVDSETFERLLNEWVSPHFDGLVASRG